MIQSNDPQKPKFDSDIPNFLLENSSERDVWLYKNINVLIQKTDWVVDECSNQSKQLNAIKIQTTETNGKVKAHQSQLAFFEELKQDLADLVRFKRISKQFLVSKWTYIALAVFFIGLITIAKSPSFIGWLQSII
jgi:hypothetical protein